MQLIAAYMQLVTPSEVAMAVRMLMAIWITIFQVSFFIIFSFLGTGDDGNGGSSSTGGGSNAGGSGTTGTEGGNKGDTGTSGGNTGEDKGNTDAGSNGDNVQITL